MVPLQIIREVNELLSWIENHNGKSFDIEDALVNLHANVILSVLISKRYSMFKGRSITNFFERYIIILQYSIGDSNRL